MNGKRLFFRVALLFGAAVGVVVGQVGHRNAFTGTWKLNPEKSTFDPGPPFQSFTIVFTSDGTRNLDLTGADGHGVKISLPWSDGKEVQVKGMENATANSKVTGRTFHDIWKQNGRVIEDVRGVVSSDGRTLTTTVDAMYEQGRPIHNRLTFEKQ